MTGKSIGGRRKTPTKPHIVYRGVVGGLDGLKVNGSEGGTSAIPSKKVRVKEEPGESPFDILLWELWAYCYFVLKCNQVFPFCSDLENGLCPLPSCSRERVDVGGCSKENTILFYTLTLPHPLLY